jgi:hypothetical protein
MADEEKKIIVDDDWKAEARAEKERLSGEAEAPTTEALPEASFMELINLLVMQAMAGLGLMADADGHRIPPNLSAAKHSIDMLQMLEDKTKGNLTDEEAKLLDQVLYEMRMRFVQMAGAGGGGAPGAPLGQA